MYVEQEYDFWSSFLLDHFFLSLSGISPFIPVAKSAFITNLSAVYVPLSVLAPITFLPSKTNSLTASLSIILTPSSLAISAIFWVIVPSPPSTWNTPCSYSRYAKIVKRLGAWKGLIPRYFVWNDMANCILSSVNILERSEDTLLHGLNTLATLKALLLMRSVGPLQGEFRQFFERLSFVLLSSIYFLNPFALSSPQSSPI